MGRPTFPEESASTPSEPHPEKYQGDLNPEPMAGLNEGVLGEHPEKGDNVRTAYDVKELHRRLQDFQDDDLKQIPVLPDESRLEQGATYIDLGEDDPQEFTARGDMLAGKHNCYVPKSEVDYQLWNRLIGVDNPERTGEADDS
ncbi:MAG TPA: hypothetical protein VGE45_03995 [Chloroflexia bacterium]|jgi:hypothetical protein